MRGCSALYASAAVLLSLGGAALAQSATPGASATTSTAAAATAPTTATTTTALAKAAPAVNRTCTRLGFSVNDYGKDGPTSDAKRLLSDYVARWAVANGIRKYNLGKSSVKCELFLNLIVVDEHTCTATADVCWSGKPSKSQLVKP